MKKILFLSVAFITGFCIEASAQRVSLSFNMAELLDLGTMGIEAQISVHQHWSLTASYRLNPWTFNAKDTFNGFYRDPDETQFQHRQQTCSLGARWWSWNVFSGWWIGSRIQYQEYNRGGALTNLTREGDAYGAALSFGYSLMIKKHFNIDFGLGCWGGYEKYVEYECPGAGKRIDMGEGLFIRPNDVIISIAYIF